AHAFLSPVQALIPIPALGVSVVRQFDTFGCVIEERIWRIWAWYYAALSRCCKRRVLIVSRLIPSRSSRIVWTRPK
ncbi:hypothetical protein, partial [Aestuariivirga sp.]|uniref:hypothetical protein n=1 Tax=Aestuariivirga sp. TaxID=2650926 RepID=UPI0037850D44